jgi:hypothetical protein
LFFLYVITPSSPNCSISSNFSFLDFASSVLGVLGVLGAVLLTNNSICLVADIGAGAASSVASSVNIDFVAGLSGFIAIGAIIFLFTFSGIIGVLGGSSS